MTRVRVTAPHASPLTQARGASKPLESREAAQESDVGQVFVRSLIRSQLRLALVVAGGFLLILAAFPLILVVVPGLADARIAGIPFGWLLLGAGIYPVIGLSAWLYVRTAARNEARYRDLAGEQ
ncbi:hypothetical protein LFT44_06540 [Arthrobacter sp. FW306-05-C]|uniref:hypothetical protein n=1 Tax=unclassified Arthrobacter TaxID=235627 RepID=UPI001EF01BED|nr:MULTISPECIES: hypothetical protein [unclassified Arthrobacter]UKA68060.1 hypothetical protein LFT44_06540 [Arthrobacter sp. FW306-05-C]UKA72587.1 hypothetical protein LFT49_07625 [Arthrobacter sp. FW306-06-A]UKA76818.1 hypothetical protein LFT46_07190 [Arthrobacter sp. FW306-07-I]